MTKHGGYALVDTLIAHGVTHVFGMPGGQANAFYDALADRKDKITHVLVRDETTAGYAADAYARVSGRIGVCDATVGPGAAKLPSGLMEAYNSSVPILALVSDHPRNAVLLQSYGRISQGGDQLSVLKPFAKEAFEVPSADMIPSVVAAAIHTAVTGRPGPVIVEIPQDVYNQTTDAEPVTGQGCFPKFRCVAPDGEIAKAVELLASAQRPLLLAGGGVQLSRAYEELRQFHEMCRIPVVTTLSGKGSLPEDDPLCLGVLGDFGNPFAIELAREADVILAVGYKHSQNSSYRWTWPAKGQKLIHLDIDPVEFGRVYQADIPLWGDAKATLGRMVRMLEGKTMSVSDSWRKRAAETKRKWSEMILTEGSSSEVPIWPQRVLQSVVNHLGPQDIVVCDASFASGWGAGFVELKRAGRGMLLPRGVAGLGYALPAGLGAALAKPGAKIVCIAGDGAFSYNVGELITLRELNVPVINVILNNSVLAWAKWTQRLNFSGRNQSVELGTVDFGAVAKCYGMAGYHVETVEQLDSAVRQALSSHEPSVIDVRTDEWQAPSVAYRKSMEKARQGIVTNQAY